MADRPTPLLWRQCVCGAWYWGTEQSESDKATSALAAPPVPLGTKSADWYEGYTLGQQDAASPVPLDVERLARALAAVSVFGKDAATTLKPYAEAIAREYAQSEETKP